MSDFRELFGDWRPEDDRPGEGGAMRPEEQTRGDRKLDEKAVRVVNVWEGIEETPVEGGTTITRGHSFFVQLRDNQGREFRIWVVREMAGSIQLALEHGQPDRPFTHDLLKVVLERLGASVERVTIDDLWQNTYYARITLAYHDATIDIDARPSDAIAMALRFDAPIYASEHVLESAQHET
ncbi:MAG: bifunctional nuclease family protein [Armatimonadetes bacterium]|nr:bifunctional nuclease family protein [Armatimonadota bacterium]MDE2205445.1 bifunctional nuclease family protein [Armatimonadota bacterium]